MMPDIEKLLVESEQKDEEGNLNQALEIAQQAVITARTSSAPDLISQAEVNLAKMLARTGQYSQARQICEAILVSPSFPHIQAEALVILGICAAETDDLNAASDHLYLAADIFRKNNDPAGLGHTFHSLANSVYLPRGQFQLALTTMQEATFLIQQTGEEHWGLPYLKAYIYQIIGDRQGVRQSLDEMLPVVKPATRVAGAYYYLWARLSLDEGELDKAAEYLRLALRIATTTSIPDLNALVRLEYSHLYRISDDAAAALSWADDALQYTRRVGSGYYYGMALVERALSSWGKGDTTSPRVDFNEAKRIFSELGNAYELTRCAFFQSAFYQENQDALAIPSWLEASDLILKNGYAFLLERERSLAFPLTASHLRGSDIQERAAAEKLLQKLADVVPPPLRVYGLGQFAVWQGRNRIPDQPWKRRKAGEVFRFLILRNNQSASRDDLLEALWPDSSPEAAVDMLHQATSTLRHILEPDLPDKFPSRYLKVEGERVFLLLPAGSRVDFIRFEQILPGAIQSGKIEQIEKALSLYTDELFPMDRYSDWSTARRQHLGELYIRGLLALGSAYLGKHQYLQALECAKRILRQDPWNEDAAFLGMRAHLGLNNAPHALRLYLDLEHTLADELHLSPRTDLRALAEQIRKR